MTRVKICGIKDAAAFDAAVAAGADWVGFNFFRNSPRYVTPSQAATLAARHPGGTKLVALLVEPTDAEVGDVVSTLKPDVLQLYTSAERSAHIRLRHGVPIWRAVGVTGADDLPGSADDADAVLIESKAPPGASRPGGRAARFDWAVLSGWKPDFAWLLAGGLTPDNVGEAIRVTGATAVDVASGVETAPGVKSVDLIHAFVAAAKTVQ